MLLFICSYITTTSAPQRKRATYNLRHEFNFLFLLSYLLLKIELARAYPLASESLRVLLGLRKCFSKVQASEPGSEAKFLSEFPLLPSLFSIKLLRDNPWKVEFVFPRQFVETGSPILQNQSQNF